MIGEIDMAFNSNGQISYLVLDSLSGGSKYGLEIIEYISQKTGGSYVMKKPTLYSCLTRMEKKGLVSSSYWGESELGGKRHYYNITPSGRENLAELAREFENYDFSQNAETEVPVAPMAEPVTEETVTEHVAEQTPATEDEQKPTFLQQDSLFDMVKPTQPVQVEEDEEENDVLDNQIDIFNMEPVPQQEESAEEETAEEPSAEEQEKIDYYQSILEQEPQKEDGGIFLEDDERAELTPDQEEQNQRLYDTSNDFKKYKSRKSFADNQIEMSVVYDKEEDDELQKERIAELKRSIISMRNQNNEAYAPEQEEQESQPAFEPFAVQQPVEEEKEELPDDGVFITGRMNETEIPIQRKITPPNIEVNIYDDNLPAPKRNSNLEPTYKDMMSKIFERRRERQVQDQTAPDATATTSNYVDYGALKKYYQSHNIEFKEYKKTNVNRNYNTNLLQLIASIVLLTFATVGSLALLWIVAATHTLNGATNFMFYTLPGLFLLYTLYSLTKYKCFHSKKASLRYTAATNWIVFLLSSLVVVIINTICGMQVETFAQYITSLVLPIYCLFILFPINFYTKKFIYRKYSK